MFGRKRDFKPDRPQSGTLSKLYITPKQRKSLLKWLLTSAVLLVISLVQDVIMSRVRILGSTTDLVACAIFTVCIMKDPEIGCVFALVSSALYFCSGSAPGSYAIALITALGVVAGIARQCYLRKSFSSTMLCTAGAILAYELILYLGGVFLGVVPAARFGIFLLRVVLSLMAMPIVYPIFLSIEKIGGEAWKE